MKKTISLLLLLINLLPFTAFGQQSVDTQIKRVEHGLLPPVLIGGDQPWSLEERMKHWKVPGLSIAVVKDFKIEWARTYGVKDVETKEPVTTDTLFQAGSISKPVAAMVALKRVQQGKISLDENINNKLVTWKLPDNAAVSEARINGLGYGFLRAKKLPEAIAYFKLNVEFYPNSFNVYDSLGEAYLANGDKELAIANYKKSLELNPKNTNATEALKKLSGTQN